MYSFRVWKLRCFWGLATVFVTTSVFFAFSRPLHWTGRKDLAVRFHVIDSRSGQSVSNAVVHIRAEGRGFCDNREPRELTVTTDGDGRAELISKQCLCGGTQGMFKDTFFIHIPSWWVHATATGYDNSEPIYLGDSGLAHEAERGTEYATISIPIDVEAFTRRTS